MSDFNEFLEQLAFFIKNVSENDLFRNFCKEENISFVFFEIQQASFIIFSGLYKTPDKFKAVLQGGACSLALSFALGSKIDKEDADILKFCSSCFIKIYSFLGGKPYIAEILYKCLKDL